MMITVKFSDEKIVQVPVVTSSVTPRQILLHLQLTPTQCTLSINGRSLVGTELITPGTTINATISAKSKSIPKFYRILWARSSSISHEAGMQKIASEIHKQITQHLSQVAEYGLHEALVDFYVGGPGVVPTVWTKAQKLYPTNCIAILDRVLILFVEQDNIIPEIVESYKTWAFNWKPKQTDNVTMPRVTTRDLVAMGYRPENGALFKSILDGLRLVIEQGKVSTDSIDAQKEWIALNFLQ